MKLKEKTVLEIIKKLQDYNILFIDADDPINKSDYSFNQVCEDYILDLLTDNDY